MVRHAAPVVSGLCGGRYDFDVEPHAAALPGIVRAVELNRIRCIRSSPAARCRALALSIAESTTLPFATDERLRELDFGEWEGRPWNEVVATDAERFRRWSDHWQTAKTPGGESLPELEQRVLSCIEGLPVEPTLLVTHAGPIRAMRVKVHGVTWSEAMDQAVPYAVPLRLDWPTRH